MSLSGQRPHVDTHVYAREGAATAVTTILRVDGFRFFFYSNESQEPPHIHVQHGGGVAKFWLDPVKDGNDFEMKPAMLKRAKLLVIENQAELLERWYETFPG